MMFEFAHRIGSIFANIVSAVIVLSCVYVWVCTVYVCDWKSIFTFIISNVLKNESIEREKNQRIQKRGIKKNLRSMLYNWQD